MTGEFVKAVLLLAALAVGANAIVIGKRSVVTGDMQAEGVPSDCAVEIDVEKRDSPLVDFRVCVKNGAVCTSRDVPTCSFAYADCNTFDPPFDEQFAQLFPDAYAEVCVQSGGDQCLYTDVVYQTCGASVQSEKICLPLTNGKMECNEIPHEQIQMLQAFGGRLRVSGHSRNQGHPPLDPFNKP